MKHFPKAAALLPAVAFWLASTPSLAAAKFHIGVCTETVTQAEDDLRGAEQLIKEYGSVASGGMIRHITYPDDFMSQQETVIDRSGAFEILQEKISVVKHFLREDRQRLSPLLRECRFGFRIGLDEV